MIINFSNLGGGGGSYTLPVATSEVLGGVKVGSGVNVDTAGTISVNAYQLSAATQNTLGGVMIGSGITVDSAGTISAQAYTLSAATSEALGGIKVGSGLTIQNDGTLSANGGGGDSTALEEITELPASPEDGAVYNYNGFIIKYVNGPGNWGKWYNKKMGSEGSKQSVVLRYASIPQSMDGEMLCSLDYYWANGYLFINLTDNQLECYDNDSKSGTPLYTIALNASAETLCTLSNTAYYISWNTGIIQIRMVYSSSYIHNTCQVSSATAHYELITEAEVKNKFVDSGYDEGTVYPVTISEKGEINGVGPAIPEQQNISVNAEYSNYLYFLGKKPNGFDRMYVPTASGATGTLLVSQGNAEPQWKTTQQALGIDFWTGTQAQYDLISTKSATTLYIIIPDE